MKKLKHTPGPWVKGYGDGVTGPTCPSALGPTCAGNEWDYTVVSKNMETIAIIPKQENGIMDSNARLIAAAPEMLEALINAYCNMDSGNFKEIESVVKKATGMSITKVLEILNEN